MVSKRTVKRKMPPKGSKKEKVLYTCDICTYTTTRLGIFEDHKRIHTGERPYCCDICGKGFTQKSNLRQHLKVHGEGVKTVFKCDTCDFTTKWKSSLQIHIRWHNGEKPYKCKYCDRSFTQSTHCTTHIRESHTDERKYQCDKCSKWFKRQEHLEKHQLFHTDTRNFACNCCDKRFHGETSLKQHKRTHLGEAGKIYKCDKCPYKSFFKNSLNVHYRTHTGEKPYSCPQCEKTFRTSGIVKIHVRMIHQGAAGKIFQCDKCKFSTANKQSLKNHTLRVHMGVKLRQNLRCKYCNKVYQSHSSYYKHRRKEHVKEFKLEARNRVGRPAMALRRSQGTAETKTMRTRSSRQQMARVSKKTLKIESGELEDERSVKKENVDDSHENTPRSQTNIPPPNIPRSPLKPSGRGKRAVIKNVKKDAEITPPKLVVKLRAPSLKAVKRQNVTTKKLSPKNKQQKTSPKVPSPRKKSEKKETVAVRKQTKRTSTPKKNIPKQAKATSKNVSNSESFEKLLEKRKHRGLEILELESKAQDAEENEESPRIIGHITSISNEDTRALGTVVTISTETLNKKDKGKGYGSLRALASAFMTEAEKTANKPQEKASVPPQPVPDYESPLDLSLPSAAPIDEPIDYSMKKRKPDNPVENPAYYTGQPLFMRVVPDGSSVTVSNASSNTENTANTTALPICRIENSQSLSRTRNTSHGEIECTAVRNASGSIVSLSSKNTRNVQVSDVEDIVINIKEEPGEVSQSQQPSFVFSISNQPDDSGTGSLTPPLSTGEGSPMDSDDQRVPAIEISPDLTSVIVKTEQGISA